MTSRKKFSSTLVAALLLATPLATAAAAPAASAHNATAESRVADSGLKLTAPSLFTAAAGTWVPVRAKIKNTTSKPARVTLKVTPKRGTQVSATSISVGKIAAGAVKVAVVRIRAGKGQTSATLKAVSAKASSEATTVSIVGGFSL